MVALSALVVIIYVAALTYVVGSATAQAKQSLSQTEYPIILFLEELLEVLSSISNSPYAYFFAVVMNFALLYGIFLVNLCSVHLMDISRELEHRRTGGRRQNEVELGLIAGVPYATVDFAAK